MLYEAVEKFAEPIKREAVKMGKQLGWYIMKRKSGGDLSELENKGIGDYIILNIFKDEAQMNLVWIGMLLLKRFTREKCLQDQ